MHIYFLTFYAVEKYTESFLGRLKVKVKVTRPLKLEILQFSKYLLHHF